MLEWKGPPLWLWGKMEGLGLLFHCSEEEVRVSGGRKNKALVLKTSGDSFPAETIPNGWKSNHHFNISTLRGMEPELQISDWSLKNKTKGTGDL